MDIAEDKYDDLLPDDNIFKLVRDFWPIAFLFIVPVVAAYYYFNLALKKQKRQYTKNITASFEDLYQRSKDPALSTNPEAVQGFLREVTTLCHRIDSYVVYSKGTYKEIEEELKLDTDRANIVNRLQNMLRNALPGRLEVIDRAFKPLRDSEAKRVELSASPNGGKLVEKGSPGRKTKTKKPVKISPAGDLAIPLKLRGKEKYGLLLPLFKITLEEGDLTEVMEMVVFKMFTLFDDNMLLAYVTEKLKKRVDELDESKTVELTNSLINRIESHMQELQTSSYINYGVVYAMFRLNPHKTDHLYQTLVRRSQDEELTPILRAVIAYYITEELTDFLQNDPNVEKLIDSYKLLIDFYLD